MLIKKISALKPLCKILSTGFPQDSYTICCLWCNSISEKRAKAYDWIHLEWIPNLSSKERSSTNCWLWNFIANEWRLNWIHQQIDGLGWSGSIARSQGCWNTRIQDWATGKQIKQEKLEHDQRESQIMSEENEMSGQSKFNCGQFQGKHEAILAEI